MSDPPVARSSQRTVLACTECARRKIRCSKTIPCTGCTRHNKAHLCRRESVAVTTRRSTNRAVNNGFAGTSANASRRDRSGEMQVRRLSPDSMLPSATDPPQSTADARLESNRSASYSAECSTTLAGSQALGPGTPSVSQHPPDVGTSEGPLTNETASALEFLAHGRRSVRQRFLAADHHSAPSFRAQGPQIPFDTYFPISLCRLLLDTQARSLVWMHTVVHMPTFQQEFEATLASGSCSKSWAALYYSILAQTVYHIHSSPILAQEVSAYSGSDITSQLFDKSFELLDQSQFMSDHRLTSVQAICLLLQVAHNLDKSDLICILVSSATRISQCLGLHRLRPDAPTSGTGFARSISSFEETMSKEMEKRIWWFLVRYDWLQIPFQSICQVHPAQFTTPMPLNCFEEPIPVATDGSIVTQASEVPTAVSWGAMLNQVSGLIWKHQDRMHTSVTRADEPKPNDSVYEHVIWADREIKRLHASWPSFMHEVNDYVGVVASKGGLPVSLMPGLVLLCTAHKVLGVHRQFQLSSFRDRRYAFTQMSCVAIAERALVAVQAWPDSPESYIARRMWTTLTHVISCSITLVFALLFKHENSLVYDVSKLRGLISFAQSFLQHEVKVSTMAARGFNLVSALSDLEQCSDGTGDLETEIANMVRKFAVSENENAAVDAAEVQQVVFPLMGPQDFLNGFGTGADTLSEYLMSETFSI